MTEIPEQLSLPELPNDPAPPIDNRPYSEKFLPQDCRWCGAPAQEGANCTKCGQDLIDSQESRNFNLHPDTICAGVFN